VGSNALGHISSSDASRTGTSDRELNFYSANWTMALFFDQSFDLVKKIAVDTERDFIFNTSMVQFTGEHVTFVGLHTLF